MIPKGLITQIGMIVVAVGILFTYIQPTLKEVQVHQDEIARMREQREQVLAVNNKLAEIVQRAQSIDPVKYQNLATYLPREVDVVAVQRDILSIAKEANVELTELSDTEVLASAPSETEELAAKTATELKKYAFTVGFSAPYETIKNFLLLVEQNNYPLHVAELNLSSAAVPAGETVASTEDLTVDMTLVTYSLALSTTTPSGQ